VMLQMMPTDCHSTAPINKTPHKCISVSFFPPSNYMLFCDECSVNLWLSTMNCQKLHFSHTSAG
jgi:hypothetical protein